jgi:ketosteroid isomerase-like protein
MSTTSAKPAFRLARRQGSEIFFIMKNIFLVLSLLILPFISLRAGDEDDVLRAERELALCYQNSDAACIEQGVMEDYTLTNSKGKITTRADDLAEARKHDPNYEIFENHDMKVRVHGAAAVVTGITRTKGISGDQSFDAEFRFTDTFVKDHGRWRLSAGQAAKITP